MLKSASAGDGAGRVPTVILTGFLGSGKTTLLNTLLSDPAWSDSAVVVNEIGDIGIDHQLVLGAKENILLLAAGCLCCEVLDSLPNTLSDLYHRRSAGTVPSFRRLLIETSGLADPRPILRALLRDPIVSHFYRLQGLVCVVDAVFGDQTLGEHYEAAAQVGMADRLVVTKTDLTGGVCPAPLGERLRALNPSASILITREQRAAWLFEPEATTVGPWLEPPGLDINVHHHTADIETVSLRLEAPVTWEGLAHWIDYLRVLHGGKLLRAKGLFNVVGLDGPVILHGVQTVFDTIRQSSWPDGDRRSRLVLIGRGLDSAELEQSLSILKHG